MRRREFITLLGGAAVAWPTAARAQDPPKPLIALPDLRSPVLMGNRLDQFRQGLKEMGYVEGDNVTIAYRWAENRMDRLPGLISDLVGLKPTLILAGGPPVATAAKAATSTIPILFLVAGDPVKMGLVASLARPGGNLTGINLFNAELTTKRLGMLREVLPHATRVAVLVNPDDAGNTAASLRDIEVANRALGFQLEIFRANSGSEIDTAFTTMVRQRQDALFVASSIYFTGQRVQLVQLAAFHRLPATYSQREFAEVGGLMSYGGDVGDAYRQLGVYAGRIIKGAKPQDLPVAQATKLELVINAKTAKMLDIAMPSTLLSIADEVIE
jgi:putative ABC transport system substrate-binding protein